jgi:hypothetical protein
MRKQAGGIPIFSLFCWNWCNWINARDCHMISKGVAASGPTRRRCSQLFRGGLQRNCSFKWDDSDRRQSSISTLARSLPAAHELGCVDQDSRVRAVRAPRCGAALFRQTHEGTTCASLTERVVFRFTRFRAIARLTELSSWAHQQHVTQQAPRDVSRIHETHAIYRQNERLQH